MSDVTALRRRVDDLEVACEDMRKRWDEEVAALTKERDEAVSVLRELLPWIEAPQCAPHKQQLALAREIVARKAVP